MARYEKKFDKNKWAEMLKIKQAEDKAVKEALRANKAAGLQISAEPYSDRPLTPKEVEEKQKNLPPGSPYLPGKSPIPSSPNLADLGPGDMSHVTEKGYYLTGEDGIHGHVYQNEGGYLKEGNMYDEGIHGLPIPRAELQIRPNNEVLLATTSADLPLGDGLIQEGLTGAQRSNKEKYDMMYLEGWYGRDEYIKHMKRTFGKDYEKYLVD